MFGRAGGRAGGRARDAQELGSAQQYFVRPASFPNYTAGMDRTLFPFASEPTLGLMDAGMDVRFTPRTATWLRTSLTSGFGLVVPIARCRSTCRCRHSSDRNAASTC